MPLWKEIRLGYVDGDLTYRGTHVMEGISESDPGWYVQKYIYEDSTVTRIRGPVRGAWSNRNNLWS